MRILFVIAVLLIGSRLSAQVSPDSAAAQDTVLAAPLPLVALHCLPNPMSQRAQLRWDVLVLDGCLHIRDASGQEVRRVPRLMGFDMVLERGELAPGLYFLELTEYGQPLARAKLLVTD